jgi:hypothetical protein
MLHVGAGKRTLRIFGSAGGGIGFPSFNLPLNDLGNGIVNTVPAQSSGSPVGTFTRASVAWTKLASGLWGQVATGIARATYLGRDTGVGPYGGYWSEPAGVQLTTPTAAIRDMTNAAWIKIGAPTITLTGTGIDGMPNSCTRIVANAPNTTILMTLVAAASARTYSPFIRRVGGSGTILIQQGVTTKDVTADLNSVTLTRCELNVSVLNVAYGVLIGSTGDSIDVDFNGFEALAATQFATSPMATAGAARAADVWTFPQAGNMDITQGMACAELSSNWTTAAGNCVAIGNRVMYSGSSLSVQIQMTDGTTFLTKSSLTDMSTGVRKRATSWGPFGMMVTGDGAAPSPAVGAFDGAMAVGAIGIGCNSVGGEQFNGVLRNVKIYPVQQSAAAFPALTFTLGPNLFVGDGNSLTFGTGAGAGFDYVKQLVALLGATWNSWNFGVPGQTTTQMSSDAATQIDPILQDGNTKHILGAWEITNELSASVAVATAYANFVAYCQARKAAGWKVIAFTVLPRSDAGLPGGFETARQSANTSIRANWPTFADALCDVAAQANIGPAGSETNVAFYAGDNIHLNANGYAIVAGLARTAVTSIP